MNWRELRRIINQWNKFDENFDGWAHKTRYSADRGSLKRCVFSVCPGAVVYTVKLLLFQLPC